jgi:heptosyltransferase-2
MPTQHMPSRLQKETRIFPDLATARRILVVTKFRYLGDTIVATPFLRRLREAIPSAQITLLSGPALPVLLKGCPYLEDMLTYDPMAPSTWKQNRELLHSLRCREFDVAFLLNRSLHSALIAALARVPLRIGFNTEYRGLLLSTRVPYSRSRCEIECYLDLLRAVGIEAEYALPKLWVTEAERLRARELLSECGVPWGTRVMLLQPGAKDPYKKQWDTHRFAAILDALAQEEGLAFVLIGAQEERPVCEKMTRLTRAPVVNLAGRTNLREALALLAEAELLISNDTALAHAAVAVGTRTVTIHGPQTAAKWGYDTPHHRVVTVPSREARVDRHTNRRTLDQISPELVIQAVRSMLKR